MTCSLSSDVDSIQSLSYGSTTKELIGAPNKNKKSPRGYKKRTAKEPPAHQSQSSNLDASKGQARENHDSLEDSTPKFKDGLYLQAVRMLPRSITLCYDTRALANGVWDINMAGSNTYNR